MSAATQDSLATAVEAMDMIEIRAARNAYQFSGQDFPLIMRGFISSVRRSEAMGSDGTPQRVVVISGMDAGKLWQVNNILAPLLWKTDTQYLTEFQAQAASGIEIKVLPVSRFMEELTGFMNTKIAALEAFANRAIPHFMTACTVRQGQVSPNLVGPYQGSLWGLARQFSDTAAWNELFVEDSEAGPTLVFRPVPYLDLDGKLIMQDAAMPDVIQLDISDVVSLDLDRSDARVANFFWTPPGESAIDTSGLAYVSAVIGGSATDFDHGGG